MSSTGATKSGLRVRILCPDTVATRTCAASTGDTVSGHVIRISGWYSWYSWYSCFLWMVSYCLQRQYLATVSGHNIRTRNPDFVAPVLDIPAIPAIPALPATPAVRNRNPDYVSGYCVRVRWPILCPTSVATIA